MLKKLKLYATVAVLFTLLGTSINADMFDPLRPEEERELRGGEQRSVGLGFQEVETKGGDKRVEFKPLESLFGSRQSRENNRNNRYIERNRNYPSNR